jgi:2Fe-2S ferredoxin
MPKINIPQRQLTLEVTSGSNLMNALLEAGIPVASSCHGKGVCSMCRVKIEGVVNAAEKFELETLKRNKCTVDERLSCQILVLSDVCVVTKYW